jgi:serine/threonine protein phosphatase PrpC
MNSGGQHPTGPVNEIRAGAESAKGLREENQDSMTRFLSRYGEVILVADGMGGHQGGATASDMVAKRYRFHLESMPPNMPLAEALQHATAQVNDEIYERGHSGDPTVAGMGSTLVLAVLTQGPNGWEVTIANAGDSRAYLVRDGMLRQLTKDHTAVQRMIDAGLLTEANARNHPNASVLTRALGQQQGTTVEVYPPVSLQGGDGLLLCSDGLSGYVVDSEIARVIAGAVEPNNIVRSLVETALQSGSDDNITVQFLRIGEKVPAPFPIPVPPPVAAVATRRGTGRLVALAVVIVAAALAWPVGQMIGKWWGGGGKKDDTQTTAKPTTTNGGHKQRTSGPRTQGGPDRTNPQLPPDLGRTQPAGQTNPSDTSQGGSRPARTQPNIEIHVPDPAKKPDWIDELKKKLPGGQALDVKFKNEEIGPLPQTGIKIVYHKGFEESLDTIENIIKEITDLKAIKVLREQFKIPEALPGVDILIVGSADIYKRGAKPRP